VRYRFRDFEADSSRFVLLRGGALVPIEPKPLQLLLHLLERHPETVPKDELLDVLWDDTAVTEGSLTRAVREVRRALREPAADEGVIRTVRGRGYGIGVEVTRNAEPDATTMGEASEPPEGASIAVLPLSSRNRNPEDSYLVEGIADDLTTRLAHNPHLFVVSQTSAAAYRGTATRAEVIGRELGVRYLLEGSARRAGDRLRVQVRLIEAATGFQLWSHSIDGDSADHFDLIDDVTTGLERELQIELHEIELERVRRKPSYDPAAWDAFRRGWSHFNLFTREDHARARELFEQAIGLESELVEAYAALGATFSSEFGMGWNLDPSLLDRAEALGRKAVGLDDRVAEGHLALAGVHIARGDPAKAVESAERAIACNPSFEVAHLFLGVAQGQQGRLDVATRAILQAQRLNPRVESPYGTVLGLIRYQLGQQEEAVAIWERMRAANPDLIQPRLPLIVHYGRLGDWETARTLAEEVRAVNPELRTTSLRRLFPSGGQTLARLDLDEVERILAESGLDDGGAG
jgi:TolB-like protein